MGCGTGGSLAILSARVAQLTHIDLVDLCPALLAVARERARDLPNVSVIEADATRWQPRRSVDRVFFSYSLTMIPAWHEALDIAWSMLAPGGRIGVVDFHLPADASRTGNGFWRRWFAHDGVHPSADHLPLLQQMFPEHHVAEQRAPVPYLPGLRVPYYRFVGQKPLD